jgi:uncharacterized repeat protein (TIGR03803 family)
MKHLAISLVLLLSTLTFAGESVIYSFKGGSDGSQPQNTGLVMDTAGNLYGTTNQGGAGLCYDGQYLVGCGVIYELSPSGGGGWTETVLYDFTAANGAPLGQIVLDGNGDLFGCTPGGGAFGDGTVFELSRVGNSWSFSVLYVFHGRDGMSPVGGIAMDAAGNLYGATYVGGSKNEGTVFQLSNIAGKWTLTRLHSFVGGNDGLEPWGPVAVNAGGTVYGTTLAGGKYEGKGGGGVIYSVAMNNGKWTEKIIHAFQGGLDGLGPRYGIFLGPDGSLYGTATGMGYKVYRVTFSNGNWQKKNIYGFGPRNLGDPESGMVIDQAGNVYGTTAMLGGNSLGTVFELSPASGKYFYNYTLLYAFRGAPDSDLPTGQLVRDGNGDLFGATELGGNTDCGPQSNENCGTVFEIAPSRALVLP